MRASERFCEHILEHHFIQRQVCHHPLEPGVLFLELFQLPDLFGFHPLVLFLLPIKGLLCDPHLANEVSHGRSEFRLLEHGDHLLQ